MLKKLIFALILMTPFSQADEIELGGMVLDRTISRFGKDFFFYYTSYWRDIPSTNGITVVVNERVYPQAGTYLWVEMEQQKVFETYFGRRQNDVKKLAEQAILISINEVARIKADSVFDSPENNQF
ncbi:MULTISPECIES: curli production assembly/transport protein CsgE [Idiomarina]|jgi:curli production assembly/transport component CsgE|uniref:Curli production assembly/transport component CsgE n=1 Tax=Idiomarina abyssalis TaxID=86102 RepID=A0A8I1G5Y4_9GAMM|nr:MULTISPECIES: curli production assembly/transport protein CsgE [Idiomarina]KPD21859.1 curli production assembly protein CsgE [Idiomarina abyssalis]MAB21995.1 curli production assembly protein CsgE [Idiomarina sp.]MAL84580.1 curli production assembly protein CsgE [Idiomarina sp.]MAO68916.1 curli production assembly protein CsgE [Idiomarina sp.]MBE92049.1 curli production assembly protein CsgE [Idiomarina sp.]|tara:strand:- start:1013 stop:1390 length:378 start_codon:yes stop_codon:yes gene_type:complete